MNRLTQSASSELAAQVTKSQQEQRLQFSLSSPPARQSVSETFFPLHYEPSYAYPVFIWLHDNGENECQIRQIMPHVSLRNYVGIAPRGTQAESEHAAPVDSYSWSQAPDHVETSLERVLQCVDEVELRFHVAEHRIFLGGYAEGGTMALRLAMLRPDLFAGVASLGGAFPEGSAPLRNIEAVRGMSVLLAQGRQSSCYPSNGLCNNLRLLHYAGISVMVRQYATGDELTSDMLRDLNTWMMQLVTGEELFPAAEPPCDE